MPWQHGEYLGFGGICRSKTGQIVVLGIVGYYGFATSEDQNSKCQTYGLESGTAEGK